MISSMVMVKSTPSNCVRVSENPVYSRERERSVSVMRRNRRQ
jgi:hypothetical protein